MKARSGGGLNEAIKSRNDKQTKQKAVKIDMSSVDRSEKLD